MGTTDLRLVLDWLDKEYQGKEVIQIAKSGDKIKVTLDINGYFSIDTDIAYITKALSGDVEPCKVTRIF